MPVIRKKGAIAFLAGFLAVAVLPGIIMQARSGTLKEPWPAPEFTHQSPDAWINSGPLSIGDLQGKVVLIDFWTFDCWNCYRSFPWLTAMENRLPEDQFMVVGIHTPEFEHEKIREDIVAKTREFGLHHPVMIDNDSSYWKAMHNRYWPSYYLLDKQGQVRAVFVGETHAEDEQAERIEKTIRLLLK